MKGFQVIAAVAALILPVMTSVAAEPGMIVSHYEPLRIVGQSATDAFSTQKAASTRSADFAFDAFGRSFELQLESNDRLFGASALAHRSGDVSVYKGRLAGQENSWARITVANGEPRGLIWDGAELIAIEATGDSPIASSGPVVFRLSDTFVQPSAMSCGVSPSVASGETVLSKLIGELDSSFAQAPGATVQINIGAIGDFEFSSNMGANAEAAILTRLNNVDGIFSSQAGVQISVEELVVYTTSSDPFSNTTDPVTLLNELGTHRQLTPAQFTQGLTHLYTGRDLDGSTVGIAYTGAVCSTNFGAGLSEGNISPTYDALIAAHEIGHNFGAPHDGDPNFQCGAEPQTFLMAPSINGNDQFSQCSIGIIQQTAASESCVFDLPTTDMTIELRGQAPTALLGGSVTMNFDATNLGSEAATGVAVDITIPNNFSFVSASSTAGTCTNGAGTVNCMIGSVNGGTTATVTLSTIANNTSSGTFVATVSADVDDDSSNNQESVTITPLPTADLAVTTPNAVLTVDQGSAVQVTIENLNSMNASNVTVSIVLDSGLRADSVNWPQGQCTMSPNAVDCQASSFSGQSSSTLALGITGLSAGQAGYSVTLATSSNEGDTSNNSATGNITVNSVAGNNPGGGGGVAGPLLLGMLGLLTLMSRRRCW